MSQLKKKKKNFYWFNFAKFFKKSWNKIKFNYLKKYQNLFKNLIKFLNKKKMKLSPKKINSSMQEEHA